MRSLVVWLALALPGLAHAHIGVRASYSSDVGDTWVFLGAQNLDDDEANELVLGIPDGLVISSLVIRDGRTGEVEWHSSEIGSDLQIRIAGWTGSAQTQEARYQEGGDDIEYPVLIARYGDSPFADVDNDGRLDLVFFDGRHDRLYVIGAGGWRADHAASR